MHVDFAYGGTTSHLKLRGKGSVGKLLDSIVFTVMGEMLGFWVVTYSCGT